jgi:hypothetical protein
MAVKNLIEIKIENRAGETIFHHAEVTSDFPPVVVAGWIVRKCGVVDFSDDDWIVLNDMHTQGKMCAKFFMGAYKVTAKNHPCM